MTLPRVPSPPIDVAINDAAGRVAAEWARYFKDVEAFQRAVKAFLEQEFP